MPEIRSTDKIVSVTGSTLAPTAAQSGCTFILSRAGGIAITLPSPVLGLEYSFIVGVAPTSVGYVITSTSDGAVASNTTYGPNFSGAGDAASDAAAEDVFTMVANSAVIGTRAHYICDGTSWYSCGQATLAASLTVA